MAISLRLRAAWILDWKDKIGDGLSKHIIKHFNYKLIHNNKTSKKNKKQKNKLANRRCWMLLFLLFYFVFVIPPFVPGKTKPSL